VDIIVATPRKQLDLHRHQDISLKKMEVLIMNDADRILDMAFIFGVRKIIYSTPTKEKPYAVHKTTPKQIIK
jgi:superfamily II DNA/RNA helicase